MNLQRTDTIEVGKKHAKGLCTSRALSFCFLRRGWVCFSTWILFCWMKFCTNRCWSTGLLGFSILFLFFSPMSGWGGGWDSGGWKGGGGGGWSNDNWRNGGGGGGGNWRDNGKGGKGGHGSRDEPAWMYQFCLVICQFITVILTFLETNPNIGKYQLPAEIFLSLGFKLATLVAF